MTNNRMNCSLWRAIRIGYVRAMICYCNAWGWKYFWKDTFFPYEKFHPMLCFAHGGSSSCEKVNRERGFTCPKCSNNCKV